MALGCADGGVRRPATACGHGGHRRTRRSVVAIDAVGCRTAVPSRSRRSRRSRSRRAGPCTGRRGGRRRRSRRRRSRSCRRSRRTRPRAATHGSVDDDGRHRRVGRRRRPPPVRAVVPTPSARRAPARCRPPALLVGALDRGAGVEERVLAERLGLTEEAVAGDDLAARADLDVGERPDGMPSRTGSTVTYQRRTPASAVTRAPSTSAPLAATTSSAICARLVLGRAGRAAGAVGSSDRRRTRQGSSCSTSVVAQPAPSGAIAVRRRARRASLVDARVVARRTRRSRARPPSHAVEPADTGRTPAGAARPRRSRPRRRRPRRRSRRLAAE